MTRIIINIEKINAHSSVSIAPGNLFSPGQQDNLKRTKPGIIGIFMLPAMIVVLYFGYTPDTFAVTGPGSAWQYCRRITLSPVTPVADLQVKVTLASGQYGNMKTDGSDLRFYDVNNNLCNYWIEIWNTGGASTIWVKVPVSGTTYLYMYYGNASATAVTNGATTFDFFDDFMGSSLSGNWATATTNGTITVSGGTVTLSNTNNGSGPPPIGLGISTSFSPSSSSFLLETKHKEGAYNRIRFYATTSSLASSPLGYDYGYFYNGSGARSTANIFWNGYQSQSVSANTDYLTAWQITDGSTYNWYTFTYPALGTVDSRTTTYGSNIRYISIGVTEVSGTSVIVDWVRVRKYNATTPSITIGNQVTNLTASITGQINELCNGQSIGSATVTATGGSGVYTYSWNSSPTQSTQIATNLPAGAFIVTVTENSIGISATANATITEPAAVSASVTGKTNITCYAGTDGTITVNASGGSGTGYTFSKAGTTWEGSGNPYIFTGLSANVQYRIRVKDSNGCTSPIIN